MTSAATSTVASSRMEIAGGGGRDMNNPVWSAAIGTMKKIEATTARTEASRSRAKRATAQARFRTIPTTNVAGQVGDRSAETGRVSNGPSGVRKTPIATFTTNAIKRRLPLNDSSAIESLKPLVDTLVEFSSHLINYLQTIRLFPVSPLGQCGGALSPSRPAPSC